MKLADVKYRKCDKCGKGYPLTHWIEPKNPHGNKPDRFKAHNNPICMVCIRDEVIQIERKKLPTKSDDKRLAKLKRMMK